MAAEERSLAVPPTTNLTSHSDASKPADLSLSLTTINTIKHTGDTPSPPSLPKKSRLFTGLTPLSQSHPPPQSGSSVADVLQASFDTFNALDRNQSHTLSVDELRQAIATFEQSGLPTVTREQAMRVMEIVAPGHDHLTFSQFHSVYSACTILAELSRYDLPHLRIKDVRRALIKAGFSPTPAQLDRMFVLSDQYSTFDKRGKIDILEFLQIYCQNPYDHTEVFLHSWFNAGRNSTPYNRPVEISPSEDFIAGTMAGIALTLVGHPLDTIKVRMQTQAEFQSLWQCLSMTVRNEGLLSLFKGMSSPLFTIPLVNAIVFSSYASAKRAMHALQPEPQPLSLGQITMAGAFAGFTNCIVTCPVELIKTRLQLQFNAMTLPKNIKLSVKRPITMPAPSTLTPAASSILTSPATLTTAALLNNARKSTLIQSSFIGATGSSIKPPLPQYHPHALLSPLSSLPHTPAFSGVTDCIRKIVEANGLKGLWRGLSATIYREVPGYAGQFFMYESLKRAFTAPGEKVTDLHASRLIMAGGFAGIFGWVLSYPQDFIKSQIQSEPYNQPTPWKKHPWLLDGGFIDCWQNTVRNHGYRALWRGFGTCVLRAWPANAAGFVAYETTLKYIKATNDTQTGATNTAALK